MEYEYVFSHIFNEFTVSNNKLELSANFDIFKYPVQYREILYKYYPSILAKYPNLAETYNLNNLENDLIKDKDLKFIPISLINTDTIQTKAFGKLLSADYKLCQELQTILTHQPQYKPKDLDNKLYQAFRNHFEYIINYNVSKDSFDEFGIFTNRIANNTIFSNESFINADLYASIVDPKYIIESLPKSIINLNINYLLQYLSTPHAYDVDKSTKSNVINVIDVKYYDKYAKCYQNQLFSQIPNEYIEQFVLTSIDNNKYIPLNVYEYPEQFQYYSIKFIKSILTNQIQLFYYIIPLFEYLAIHDEYKGEWVKLNPSDMEYDLYEVDDKTIRLNDKGIKEKYTFFTDKSIRSLLIKLIDIKLNNVNEFVEFEKLNIKQLRERLIRKDNPIIKKSKCDSNVLLNIFIEHAEYLHNTFNINIDEKFMLDFDLENKDIRKTVITTASLDLFYKAFNHKLTFAILDEIDVSMVYVLIEKIISYYNDNNTRNKSLQLLNIFDINDKDIIKILIKYEQKENNEQFTNKLISFIREIITNNKPYCIDEDLCEFIVNHFDDNDLYKFNELHMKWFEIDENGDKYAENIWNQYIILDACKNEHIEIIYKYLHDLVDKQQLTEIECKYVINKYFDSTNNLASINPKLADVGVHFVQVYHAEPYYEIYAPPNHIYNGVSNSKAWAKFNMFGIPSEMKNDAFYNFMVKCNGKKKDDLETSCYTFFSNSLENKIIFVEAKNVLTEPAVLRFDIPIKFKELKRFLHESIDTNDICMFASMTNDDWDKVAGGKKNTDCVVFSDVKNIYRQRTPLKNVIKHLIDNIEIEYDIKVVSEFE